MAFILLWDGNIALYICERSTTIKVVVSLYFFISWTKYSILGSCSERGQVDPDVLRTCH